MTTTVSAYRISSTSSTKPSAPPAFWAGLLGWLQRKTAALAKRRQLRRDLHGFEPRLLLDMGVDPADLYGEFWSYDEVQRRQAGRLNNVRPLPWR